MFGIDYNNPNNLKLVYVGGSSPVHVSPVREIFRLNTDFRSHPFYLDEFSPEPAATTRHNFSFRRNRRSGRPPIEKFHDEFYAWAASHGIGP